MSTIANTPGTRVRGEAKPGDRVSYSDIANPQTTYEVIERTGPAEYMLITDEGVVEWSDLRQYGWQFE